MLNKKCTVNIPQFDEARPVAEIVQTASQFDSKIYIDCEEKHVNAKSIMGMMTLTLTNGTAVLISADGQDEDEALEKIKEFLTKG